jgi:hypothetical protein
MHLNVILHLLNILCALFPKGFTNKVKCTFVVDALRITNVAIVTIISAKMATSTPPFQCYAIFELQLTVWVVKIT